MAQPSSLLKKKAAEAKALRETAPTKEEVAAKNPIRDLVPQEAKEEKSNGTALPKATTAAAPKRDAAAYEQAKAEKTTYAKPANFVAPSQQLYDDAEKEYNDYINSEEHKNLKLQNMAIEAVNTMPANSASSYAARMQNQNLQQVQEDTKEKELRAKRDYYKNMVNAENDRFVMESDLAELATWTEEDREQLQKYISSDSKTGNLLVNSNPLLWFGANKSLGDSAKYLYGKYGEEKTKQLASSYSRYLNEEEAGKIQEDTKEAVNKSTMSAIGHNILGVGTRLFGGLQATADRFGEALDRDERYPTLAPYTSGDLMSLHGNTVTAQTAQNIAGEDGGILRQGAAYLYQGGMTMVDSLARAAAGGGAGGAAALAACNAFSQTVSDASRQGATPEQAYTLGAAVAGVEYLSEKIPMERVFKLAKAGDTKVLAQAFKQAGIEISTEELSLFGTMAAEAAILREKSAYKQQIGEAIANGMTYDEAKAQADKAVWEQVKQTAAVSGIFGMASGGSSAIVGNVFGGDAQTPTQETQAAEAAVAPDTQTQAEQPTQEQPQQDVAQAVAQELTQAQQAEADAKAAQAQTQEAIAQGMAEQYGPMMPQAEPKSQLQQDIDNATAAMLAEQGIGEQAAQTETEQQAQQQTEAEAPVAELAENQDIKGTGAAEQNFSGKAQYQDLLYEGNVQPDREGDVRPMEVPKTDLEGKPVSATAANTYGSQFTTDDLASAEESAIAKGDLSYMEISNDQAAERATKKIEDAGGWREAYMQWHDEVRDGKTSAEMAARGAMLLNHAAEVYEQTKATGDVEATKAAKQEWLSILMDVREMGTNTAQGLQAMRMIRNLAPPDKLDFAVASVKRMVSNMKLQNDVTIDENLLNEYRMAETDEQRNEIMGKIQQNVADQIPSTFLDKWTALRYMNMLGNLKTNVRNVAGNVGSAIAYRIKNQFQATMEDMISVFNKDYQRTTSHAVSSKLMQFARDDFNAVKSAINGGGKYNERMAAEDDFQQGVMDRRRIFKSNAENETDRKVNDILLAPLEGYRKATNWMMNNKYFGDEAFGRAAYARALAGYLKANGVKDGDLSNVDPNLLDKARAHAIKEAQEATFKDNTALANIASNIKKATGVVGEGIVPFTKTPANVLVRAEEFSPLGILNTAYKAAQMAAGKSNLVEKNGIAGNFARSGENVTGADIVNSMAKTLTGTALFALGALLWDNGMLSAGPSDDEEEAMLDDLTGKQPYALQFMGEDGQMHSYTMDWLTPVAMPMFMGAEFWKAMQESNSDMTFADYEKLFTSIADPMIQMSMLQGLNDSLDSIKYAGNNLGQFFLNAAASYLTQGLTNTLMGQIERSMEENRQTTYIDENSNVPKWLQREIGKASQKIPGWDYQQMEYRNNWGETEANEGGLAYNLASPGYASTEKNDAVAQELYRLNEAVSEKVTPPDIPKKLSYTDKNGNEIKDYQLTEDQYQTIAVTQGQTAKKVLGAMTKSMEYKNLTDVQKAYAINAAYEYAQEKGKQAALPDYYSKASAWIAETRESDTAAFIARGARKALDDAIGNAVNAQANNWAVSDAAKADMDATYKAFSKMYPKTQAKILDELSTDALRYIEGRKGGATTKNYLDATKNVQRLGDNPKPAQEYGAIANTSGMTDSAKDALIKAYIPDYKPESSSPNTTELKYDYAREEMNLSPQEFAEVYRVHTEGGKKDEKYAKWKEQGYNEAECDLLWELFGATGKNKTDVVSWHNSK